MISLVLLAIALLALYGKHLAGTWRWIYVATAVAALWFNVFVLIVQAFKKISILNPHAPQVGPPFPSRRTCNSSSRKARRWSIFVVLG